MIYKITQTVIILIFSLILLLETYKENNIYLFITIWIFQAYLFYYYVLWANVKNVECKLKNDKR